MKRDRRPTAGFPLILGAALVLGATAGFAAQPERPLSFASDVVPILTKASCNSGGCHAKAGNGQNGFRLSLLGFEPREDYEHIVKEGHGRRVFPAAPEQSLLLLKAANVVPHGGGKRLDPGSESYQRLARWIGQGLAYGNPADPTVASISVEPGRSVLPVHAKAQLKVRAHYSDGHAEDVTRLALYESNDRAMAEVDDQGLVTIQDIPGTVAVMVRYQGMVAVALASIPLGAAVDRTPPETNFIDSLVFANLKELGIPPHPSATTPRSSAAPRSISRAACPRSRKSARSYRAPSRRSATA